MYRGRGGAGDRSPRNRQGDPETLKNNFAVAKIFDFFHLSVGARALSIVTVGMYFHTNPIIFQLKVYIISVKSITNFSCALYTPYGKQILPFVVLSLKKFSGYAPDGPDTMILLH